MKSGNCSRTSTSPPNGCTSICAQSREGHPSELVCQVAPFRTAALFCGGCRPNEAAPGTDRKGLLGLLDIAKTFQSSRSWPTSDFQGRHFFVQGLSSH